MKAAKSVSKEVRGQESQSVTLGATLRALANSRKEKEEDLLVLREKYSPTKSELTRFRSALQKVVGDCIESFTDSCFSLLEEKLMSAASKEDRAQYTVTAFLCREKTWTRDSPFACEHEPLVLQYVYKARVIDESRLPKNYSDTVLRYYRITKEQLGGLSEFLVNSIYRKATERAEEMAATIARRLVSDSKDKLYTKRHVKECLAQFLNKDSISLSLFGSTDLVCSRGELPASCFPLIAARLWTTDQGVTCDLRYEYQTHIKYEDSVRKTLASENSILTIMWDR